MGDQPNISQILAALGELLPGLLETPRYLTLLV